ncbi:MAG: protein-tyrosine phosphatase family protein [Cellvibrionaceae bacterium]
MTDISIEYSSLLKGALAIGHRPKLKKLNLFQQQGTTHIWTLLSEREGALDIRKASRKAGLEWLWLPLANGKPPEDDLLPEIKTCFDECKAALEQGGFIYLHCSAGIHRTGMISYAFLRYLEFSEEEALAKLGELRTLTQEGVGDDRLAWGNENFG